MCIRDSSARVRTSDDSYIYQLSLVLATATVSLMNAIPYVRTYAGACLGLVAGCRLVVVVVFTIEPFFLPNDISSTPSVLPDSSS